MLHGCYDVVDETRLVLVPEHLSCLTGAAVIKRYGCRNSRYRLYITCGSPYYYGLSMPLKYRHVSSRLLFPRAGLTTLPVLMYIDNAMMHHHDVWIV